MNYGDAVSVQCFVSGGDLPVGIRWKWNNQTIGDSDKLKDILIEKRGGRVSTLFIEAVTARHIGVYTCVAENRAGVSEQTSDLKVNGLSMTFCLKYFKIIVLSTLV
jgi:Immunoglobulin domain